MIAIQKEPVDVGRPNLDFSPAVAPDEQTLSRPLADRFLGGRGVLGSLSRGHPAFRTGMPARAMSHHGPHRTQERRHSDGQPFNDPRGVLSEVVVTRRDNLPLLDRQGCFLRERSGSSIHFLRYAPLAAA